ncbi:MAG: hypothetical protein KGL25_02865 [Gammaproteobacteria bacterium]|nr:hypothetical protein [Gammaproteobacteria bacterium]
MRNAIYRSLALFAASALLVAGPALAGDEPQGAQLPKTYADHELTDAQKAALAKRRLESCRLHPGSCEQHAKGAKGAKDAKGAKQGKVEPDGAAPSKPPVEGNPK